MKYKFVMTESAIIQPKKKKIKDEIKKKKKLHLKTIAVIVVKAILEIV